MGNHQGISTLQNIKSFIAISTAQYWPNTIHDFDSFVCINVAGNPQQDNGDDCGVFTLAAAYNIINRIQYVERITNDSIVSLLSFDRNSMNRWRQKIRHEIETSTIPLQQAEQVLARHLVEDTN